MNHEHFTNVLNSNMSVLSNIFNMKAAPTELRECVFLLDDPNKIDKVIKKYLRAVVDLNQPGRKVSPNFLKYGSATNLFEVMNNGIVFEDRLIKVKKQDLFTFQLLKKLRKVVKSSTNYIDQEIYKYLFKYDEDYGIDLFIGNIESPKNYDPRSRVDLELSFSIGDKNYSYIVEYFEKRVHKSTDLYFEDEVRLTRIFRNNPDVFGVGIYLEDNHCKDNFNKFVKHICRTLGDHIASADVSKYVVKSLEEITGSREFSELLYKSYKNKEEYAISINILNSFLTWKHKKESKCKKEYLEYFLEIANDECEEQDEGYFVNWNGFSDYLLLIDPKFLGNVDEKKVIVGFYRDIVSTLIETYEEIAEKLKYEKIYYNI